MMNNNRKSIQDYKIELSCLYSGSLCSLLNNIMINIKYFFCSISKLCPTLCNPMNCRRTSFPVLHCHPEFAQMHVHWVDDVIQPSHPLLPPLPPALNFSQMVFYNESALHNRWPMYWNFSFSISLSSEYSGLIFLRLSGLIFLLSKRLSRVFLSTTIWKD